LGIEIRRRAERSRARNAEAWTLVQRADRLSEDIPRTWAREPAAVPAALDRADSLLARGERLDAAWVEPTLRRAWLARTRARHLPPTPWPGPPGASPAATGPSPPGSAPPCAAPGAPAPGPATWPTPRARRPRRPSARRSRTRSGQRAGRPPIQRSSRRAGPF